MRNGEPFLIVATLIAVVSGSSTVLERLALHVNSDPRYSYVEWDFLRSIIFHQHGLKK